MKLLYDQSHELLLNILSTIFTIIEQLFLKFKHPIISILIYRILSNFLLASTPFITFDELNSYFPTLIPFLQALSECCLNDENLYNSHFPIKFLNNFLLFSYQSSIPVVSEKLDFFIACAKQLLTINTSFDIVNLRYSLELIQILLNISYVQTKLEKDLPEIVQTIISPFFFLTDEEAKIEETNVFQFINMFHHYDLSEQYTKKDIGNSLVRVFSRFFASFPYILLEYSSNCLRAQPQSPQIIYVGLQLLISLSSILDSYLEESNILQIILSIAPFLDHSSSFIRAAAFELLYSYDQIDIPIDFLLKSIEHLCDSSLLVQFFALSSFSTILLQKNNNNEIDQIKYSLCQIIEPHFPQILQNVCFFLTLSNDIRVIIFFEIFLDIFQEFIPPFKGPILTTLITLFSDFIEYNSQEYNDNEDNIEPDVKYEEMNCLSDMILSILQDIDDISAYQYVVTSLFGHSILESPLSEGIIVILFDFMKSLVAILPDNFPIELYKYFIYNPLQLPSQKIIRHYFKTLTQILTVKGPNYFPVDSLLPCLELMFNTVLSTSEENDDLHNNDFYFFSSIIFDSIPSLFVLFSNTDALNNFVPLAINFFQKFYQIDPDDIRLGKFLGSLLLYNSSLIHIVSEQIPNYLDVLIDKKDISFFPRFVIASFSEIPDDQKLLLLLAVTDCFQENLSIIDESQNENDLNIAGISGLFYEFLANIQKADPILWNEYNDRSFPFFQETLPLFISSLLELYQ